MYTVLPDPHKLYVHGVIYIPDPHKLNVHGVIYIPDPHKLNVHGVIYIPDPHKLNVHGVIYHCIHMYWDLKRVEPIMLIFNPVILFRNSYHPSLLFLLHAPIIPIIPVISFSNQLPHEIYTQ